MINEELELHLDNIIQNMKEMTDILKRSKDNYESVGDTRFKFREYDSKYERNDCYSQKI